MTARLFYLFKQEAEYVANMMQRNDPNGEYTAEDVAAYPLEHITILEQWKEDCAGDVPKWIDTCIDYLMLFTC